MMSRFCFRPTVRTCTGLFVLASIFVLLVTIMNAWNSAISESTQSLDSEALNARSKIGKVLGNCSLQRTEVSACVSGYLATVTAIQNFVNNNMRPGETEDLRIRPVYAQANSNRTSQWPLAYGNVIELCVYSIWVEAENRTIQRLGHCLYYLTGWLRDASLNANPILCGNDYWNWSSSFRQELIPILESIMWAFMGGSVATLIRNLAKGTRHWGEEVCSFGFALAALYALGTLHAHGVLQFYEANKGFMYGSSRFLSADDAMGSLPQIVLNSATGLLSHADIFSLGIHRTTQLFVVALLTFLISMFLAIRWIHLVLLSIQFLSAFLFFSMLASKEKSELFIPFVKWSAELSLWSLLWQSAFRNLWMLGSSDASVLLKLEVLIVMYTLLNALVIWRGRTLILRYCSLMRAALSPGVVHVQ